MDGLKRDQHTTPLDLIVPPQETITVVDPCHPLFGRTLPCVGIANSCHRGRCCIVWIRPTVERHVPIAATNLAYDPTTLYPLPISVPALRQFLQEFAWATRASEGEQADGDVTSSRIPAKSRTRSPASSDPTRQGLGHPDPRPTGNDAASPRSHVPGVPASHPGGDV